MVNIQSTQPTSSTPGGAIVPQKENSGFAGVDFETFLKMLTTQIKNQDPMNPMEGSDFAVQLATFSGVEQQVKANALLQAIAGQSATADLASYSDWIGRQVSTTGNSYFAGTPLVMDINPTAASDRAVLVTHDSFGRRVSAEEVGTASGLIQWAGKDSDGKAYPPGLYSFTLESYAGEQLLGQVNVPVYAAVNEVKRGPDGISFILNGGAIARLDQVESLGMAAK